MKFEFWNDKDWRFRLLKDDGDVTLRSEGYTARASCLNGIQSVQENGRNEAQYHRKLSDDGKPMFNLKAGNGEVIGTSELYESEGKRESDIQAIKAGAAVAEVVETEGP